MSDAPARLLLLRHGESTWNADGRWQGQADPPLSALGERQAEVAADTLRRLGPVSAVWSSDLVRARRTAELVAPDGMAVQLDARLRERGAGEWTGLTRAQIRERYPGYLEARRSPSGFEDDDAMLARVVPSLVEIAGRGSGGTLLVVTHGGVLRALERHLDGDDARFANLAGRWVLVDGSGLALGERALLVEPDEVEVTIPPET